jgi:hypothetical protein
MSDESIELPEEDDRPIAAAWVAERSYGGAVRSGPLASVVLYRQQRTIC